MFFILVAEKYTVLLVQLAASLLRMCNSPVSPRFASSISMLAGPKLVTL